MDILLITNEAGSEFDHLRTSNHWIHMLSLEKDSVIPILHMRNEVERSQTTSQNYNTNMW